MNLTFRVQEELTVASRNSLIQERFTISPNLSKLDINKKISKKLSKKRKNKEPEPSFEISSSEVIKNKREKDYIGSYCRDTFRKYKNWKNGLNQEDRSENEFGILLEKPKETYKTFNSIELFDVIGCLKLNRPHHPKAYIVIDKNKEEEKLTVIPWQPNWLQTNQTKDTITNQAKEYQHKFKNINLDNKISIEDISLSISLERFAKLYKLDKTTNRFVVPAEDSRRVRIVRLVKQELNKPLEVIA